MEDVRRVRDGLLLRLPEERPPRRVLLHLGLRLAAGLLQEGRTDLCAEELATCQALLHLHTDRLEASKEVAMDTLLLLLLHLELCIATGELEAAAASREKVLVAGSLGGLSNHFSRLCLEASRRAGEAAPWLRSILALPRDLVHVEVRDAAVKRLLREEPREEVVEQLSSPLEQEVVMVELFQRLPPTTTTISHPHLLHLLAACRSSPRPCRELVARVCALAGLPNPRLTAQEWEEVVTVAAVCAGEDRVAAHQAVCTYAALGTHPPPARPGLPLVLQMGAAAVAACLEEQELAEAEKWLNLLTFLSSSDTRCRAAFTQLADTLVVLLLRQRRATEAAALLDTWARCGQVSAGLRLRVHLATGDGRRAVAALQEMVGEEGREGAEALLVSLLEQEVVDKGSLRELVVALESRAFYDSLPLVLLSCRVAQLLNLPELLPTLLSSATVRRVVVEQDAAASVSSLCWHVGLAAGECLTFPLKLRHDLLLLAALLLPPGQGAALPVRMASIAAGLEALGKEVEEELVQRVVESLEWVESMAREQRVARAVRLYRVKLAVLRGEAVAPLVTSLAQLGEPSCLRAAALVVLESGRDEEAAVMALMAASRLEPEASERQLGVAAALEVMARRPALWNSRVVATVREVAWCRGRAAKMAVMELWNCWVRGLVVTMMVSQVRLGSREGSGWAEGLVCLHNLLTEPVDQIRWRVGEAALTRAVLDKVNRLLNTLDEPTFQSFDLDRLFTEV